MQKTKQTTQTDQKKFNLELKDFLTTSFDSYQAVKNIKFLLLEAGFKELNLAEPWDLQPKTRYFLTSDDEAIIAFNYADPSKSEWRLAGGHTDSPHLKIKFDTNFIKANLAQVAVEPYGGVLLQSWFDRELALAGKITYLNKQNQLKSQIISINKPIAIIPNLSIHLNRGANDGWAIDKQKHLSPIFASGLEDFSLEKLILENSEPNLDDLKEILNYDLGFYPYQGAEIIGLNQDFIVSARLDNLLSCFATTKAVLDADLEQNFLIVLNSHEEVGSNTKNGAAGPLLKYVMQRIGATQEKCSQIYASSILFSCDNAQGLHPNFLEKYDQDNAPLLNKGVALKINANQRYATGAYSGGVFKLAAKLAGCETQVFISNNQMGCGSTIGPITATALGINTLDIGIAQLAMHSTREIAGLQDIFDMYKILLEFFKLENF